MPSRRQVLSLAVLGTALAAGYGALAFRLPDGPVLTAPQALQAAAEGRLILVDIRRPDEWAATGSPAPAHRLDMRDPAFTDRLFQLTAGDPTRPIALICAAGVRSARLAARLRDAGFTNVSDVAEGMRGSAAGPGWLARGLPLTRP
jgi:rhodanese-related sulfurtransferase